MKKLLKHLKEYTKETILGPLFKLMEATLELFVPLVVASVIDVGIANADTAHIVRMCLVLVVLGAVGLGLAVTAQYFSAKAAVGFVAKIRHALFAHIQSFSYAQLDKLGTSTLITRMTSDANQVQNGLNLTLRLLLRSPFVVFGAMVMAFTIDVPSAWIFAVVIPVLCVVVFGIMLACIPLYKRVQQRLDKVLGITRGNLTGVRVLRAFCKEDEQEAEFVRHNEELTSTQKFVGRISALMNPLTYVIINIAIIVLIQTGALRVEMGILTQGAVVALYNYMSQILTELVKMANLIINITKAVACANRIQSVLDIEPDMPVLDASTAADSGYKVEFSGAGLQYPDTAEPALQNIDLRVKPGETIGVIGGTGSGKSSLVQMIPRFYDAVQGAVFVDGKDVRSWNKEELRSKIGMVPQKAVLFHGTIRDNLLWGNEDASDEELWAALLTAQAEDVVRSKIDGLGAVVEQGGRNFSGGQRQRLTIARALVRKPEILILDDSASALDFATDAALRKALRELRPSPTIFIVSQRTSSLQHADQILVLDDGEAVGLGKHEELLKNCSVYREIYDSQFKKEATGV